MHRTGRVLFTIALVMSAVGPVSAQLASRSFVPLGTVPGNDPQTYKPKIESVVAREDGLVFVASSERQSVFIVDARNPAAPALVKEIVGFGVDVCGLSFDPVANRLWCGGDDRNPDSNGLFFLDLPVNAFNPAALFPAPVAVAGVESGVTPNIFLGVDGKRYIAIANRWCFPIRIVDMDAVPPTLYGGATFMPTTRQRMADMSVFRTSNGQTLAPVAMIYGGVLVLDLTNFPPSSLLTPLPLITRFDWTFAAPDFDGNPATNDPCDRNGDGDPLECGEGGDLGLNGRRYGSAVQALLAEVASNLYLVTRDSRLAGHVKIWSWDDVLTLCPTPTSCLSDEDCVSSLCPNRTSPDPAPNTTCATSWPVVDTVTPVAFYQIVKCPLASTSIQAFGTMLFVGEAEDGLHVIDLTAAGLRATSGGLPPDPLTPMATFDTLPSDSDSILENYPCHPTPATVPNPPQTTCESQMGPTWPVNTCPTVPPVMAVVTNVGFLSATAAFWDGCHVYLGDQGSPDVDGQPTHVGAQPGLWILDLGGSASFGCDRVSIFDGCQSDPALDDGLVDRREVVTMDVQLRNHAAPISTVIATFSSPASEVNFNVRDQDGNRIIDPLQVASRSSIIGALPTGSSVARVQWTWDSPACIDSPVPFTITLTSAGTVVDSLDVWMDDYDRSCIDGGWFLAPDPVAPRLPGLTTRNTEFLPVSCASGTQPVVFEWLPDLAVSRYNLYVGDGATLIAGGGYDYFTAASRGFANLPCIDDYGPLGMGPDGLCEFCDPDETPVSNAYYILTGEIDCPAAPSLKGLEGSTGATSTGIERPMGGGSP